MCSISLIKLGSMIGNSGTCLKSLATVQVELVYNPSENFYHKKRPRGWHCLANTCVFFISFSYSQALKSFNGRLLFPSNETHPWIWQKHWLGTVLGFCSQLVLDWVLTTDIYVQDECCGYRRWIHRVCTKLRRVPLRYHCGKCAKIQWLQFLLSRFFRFPKCCYMWNDNAKLHCHTISALNGCQRDLNLLPAEFRCRRTIVSCMSRFGAGTAAPPLAFQSTWRGVAAAGP